MKLDPNHPMTYLLLWLIGLATVLSSELLYRLVMRLIDP